MMHGRRNAERGHPMIHVKISRVGTPGDSSTLAQGDKNGFTNLSGGGANPVKCVLAQNAVGRP